MDRRRLLGLAVGGVTAVSGCLGYSIERSDTVQQRQDRISTLESELSRREEEFDRLEENNERLRAAVDREEKRHIVVRYRDGVAIQNAANTRWNEAQQAFGDAQYRTARRRFHTVAGYWGSAAIAFRNAANAAADLGENNAEQACTAARNHCALMVNASNHWARGAGQYANGNPTAGNDAIEDGRSATTDADSFIVVPLSELRSRLGLTE